jgi:hypothetical protein
MSCIAESRALACVADDRANRNDAEVFQGRCQIYQCRHAEVSHADNTSTPSHQWAQTRLASRTSNILCL